MQTIQKKGLTVKDLVTIGIFSALFLVFALVGGIHIQYWRKIQLCSQ